MHPFSLLIKPASADCNLRCKYCFYLDRCRLYPDTRTHRMSETVLETMIRTFMQTNQSQYAFGWQGGEPTLMGLNFFRRMTELQQKHGRSGAVVANGVQTNGTLIDEDLARHFADFHFLLGVSLDGPPEVHNRYRRYADGRGSHADVLRGIRLLQQHRVDFNILTLVNDVNVREPVKIYRYLRDQGFLFHQYIECVEFDEDGNLMPFSVQGEAWGDFLCAIFDEWIKTDTRKVSIRLFDSILTLMVDGVTNVCQMGTDCRQYFVVEHNGDVYPCDFFVRPELRLGNVMSDPWESLAASPVYESFGRRKSDCHSNCVACPFLRFCAADCPKNRCADGRESKRLSALCAGWKKFYGHTLDRFEQLADTIRKERAEQALRERRQHHALGDRKVGRNAPCPCGSGKKFKHCCGR